MTRKVLKDFTFSNGTTALRGSRVCVASNAIHNDNEYYPNPDVFDGFRFAEVSPGESVNHQMVRITLCLDCNVWLFGLVVGCYQSRLCPFWARQICVVRTNVLSLTPVLTISSIVREGSSPLTSWKLCWLILSSPTMWSSRRKVSDPPIFGLLQVAYQIVPERYSLGSVGYKVLKNIFNSCYSVYVLYS